SPLMLLRFLFEFFHAKRQSAEGVGKKGFRTDHDGKSHLPTDIFGRNSGHCRVQQSLTHSDITPFTRAARNEFHILVWIEAKVLNHPSSLRTSFRAFCITRREIKESVMYTAEGDR